jgi:glutamyl-Q tRNA(Asp) synthetase
VTFDDLVQGQVRQDLAVESGDFLLKRADGLYSYSLAVAVDDAREGITEVIRGADLLAQTPRQIYVMRQLGYRPPAYGHIPIATNHLGQKWSKQSGAPSLDNSKATANLVDAMEFLGLPTVSHMKSMTVDRLLAWGTAEFRLERLNKIKAKVMHIPV